MTSGVDIFWLVYFYSEEHTESFGTLFVEKGTSRSTHVTMIFFLNSFEETDNENTFTIFYMFAMKRHIMSTSQ